MTIHKSNTLLYSIPVCKQGKGLSFESLYIGKPIFEPRSLQISDLFFYFIEFWVHFPHMLVDFGTGWETIPLYHYTYNRIEVNP